MSEICKECASFRRVVGNGYNRGACGHPLRSSMSCFPKERTPALTEECDDFHDGEPLVHELEEEEMDILLDIRDEYDVMCLEYRDAVRDMAEERYERV